MSIRESKLSTQFIAVDILRQIDYLRFFEIFIECKTTKLVQKVVGITYQFHIAGIDIGRSCDVVNSIFMCEYSHF